MGKIHSKTVKHDQYEFDSETEYRYYLHIKDDPNIKDIVIHPEYEVIPPYEVSCKRCGGNGQTFNDKTGNFNKCRLCKGVGKRERPSATYTPDFKITYMDGYVEFIDIKGSEYQTKDKAFRLRARLFESIYGHELIMIYPKRKEWVRK